MDLKAVKSKIVTLLGIKLEAAAASQPAVIEQIIEDK